MANEKRLIDANALNWRASQKRMVELFPNWKELPQEVKDMLCKHGKEFERLLKEAPTVDAVEVVHAKWRLETDDEEPNWFFKLVVCTACNKTADGTYNYCPNCGAKMDGGNEDGN